MSAAKKIPPSTIFVKEKSVQNIKWEYIHIGRDLSPQQVLDAVIKQKAEHVVNDGGSDYEREVGVSVLMQGEPEEFFLNPVMSIIDPTGTGRKDGSAIEALNFKFSKAGDKTHALRAVEELLQKEKTSNSLRSDIMVIVDELVTNAIYNAPFVDKENSKVGASRSAENVQMHDGKQARLMVGLCADKIVVGVQDPYGTLNVEKLLERIKRCYDNGVAGSMNMTGDGGAGIGSFMVFNSSSSYYLTVDEGKNTTVCASLPLKMSSRARQELPKNIHIIVRKKE